MNSIVNQRGFRREYLPTPRTYYERALSITAGRSGWRTVRCPFHNDKHASLSVHLDHGGFRCHACGAKGGDVLAFHMLRHGLGFKAAAKELGAWV
jgi:DNA primase